MHHHPTRLFPLLVPAMALLLTAGCATRDAGVDLLRTQRDTLAVRFTKPGEFEARYQNARNDRAARNELLWELIRFVDTNYELVERGLYGKTSWGNFSTSATVIGLNTASVLSGSEGAKTAIAALTAAIEGTSAEFNRSILQNQTMPTLIARMRADRAKQYRIIRKSMLLSTTEYPVGEGIRDITAYYKAGTFVGAIAEITQEAAVQEKAAEETLNRELRKITPL